MSSTARNNLVILSVGWTSVLIVLAVLLSNHVLTILKAQDIQAESIAIRLFCFGYSLLFFLLSTMPLLMIVGYHGIRGPVAVEEIRETLQLCRLSDEQVDTNFRHLIERTSFHAFLLPMLVNLGFLMV